MIEENPIEESKNHYFNDSYEHERNFSIPHKNNRLSIGAFIYFLKLFTHGLASQFSMIQMFCARCISKQKFFILAKIMIVPAKGPQIFHWGIVGTPWAEPRGHKFDPQAWPQYSSHRYEISGFFSPKPFLTTKIWR
jgi:hypothetical protein